MQVEDLVQSKPYTALIELVVDKLNIEINDNVPSVLYDHDRRRLNAAQISPDELYQLISDPAHKSKLVNFAVATIKSANGEEEEYPAGQKPPKEEAPTTVKTLPYYKSFLITFFVQYYLFENKPDQVVAYYKATRTPNVAKHKKLMFGIYESLF